MQFSEIKQAFKEDTVYLRKQLATLSNEHSSLSEKYKITTIKKSDIRKELAKKSNEHLMHSKTYEIISDLNNNIKIANSENDLKSVGGFKDKLDKLNIKTTDDIIYYDKEFYIKTEKQDLKQLYDNLEANKQNVLKRIKMDITNNESTNPKYEELKKLGIRLLAIPN